MAWKYWDLEANIALLACTITSSDDDGGDDDDDDDEAAVLALSSSPSLLLVFLARLDGCLSEEPTLTYRKACLRSIQACTNRQLC